MNPLSLCIPLPCMRICLSAYGFRLDELCHGSIAELQLVLDSLVRLHLQKENSIIDGGVARYCTSKFCWTMNSLPSLNAGPCTTNERGTYVCPFRPWLRTSTLLWSSFGLELLSSRLVPCFSIAFSECTQYFNACVFLSDG
jgi:hypothetical protein